MGYYNSSSAYDLSAYEQRNEAAGPELKVASAQKLRKGTSLFSMRVASYFIVVVTLVTLTVYNQAQINEVSGTINSLNRQLSQLESENVRMTSELEAILSLPAIGEQAKNELGMSMLDKYQTFYICLEQEDKSVITEHTPELSTGDELQMTIISAIKRIQEYISGE